MSFAEKKISPQSENGLTNFVLFNQTYGDSRFIRFAWSSLIVLFSSLILFLIIKTSIDWVIIKFITKYFRLPLVGLS